MAIETRSVTVATVATAGVGGGLNEASQSRRDDDQVSARLHAARGRAARRE